MFIAALFTIAKIWKQPKYPSVDEWIKKDVVYIHNEILFNHRKGWKGRKEILPFLINGWTLSTFC